MRQGKEVPMKKMFIALVMLCGLVISSNYRGYAKTCEGYELKLKKTEIDVYLHGDEPNYLNYLEVVDKCGKSINYDKRALMINDYQVDLSKIGRYKVVITLLIEDYHDTEVIYVNVKEDLTPPIITGLYPKYYFKQGITLNQDLFLTSNLKVYDEFDGDLTDKIEVDYSKIDTNSIGEYEVLFFVKDSNNNEAQESVKVYIMETLPELLMGVTDLTIEVFSTLPNFFENLTVYEEEGMRAKVSIDHSNLRLDELGIYEIKYTAELFNIIETKYQRITVVDTTSPVIFGVKEIRIKAGEKLNLYKYFTVNDNFDEVISLMFKGNYNTKKVGTYKLTCIAKDHSGNTSEYPFILIVEKNQGSFWLWFVCILGSVSLLIVGIWYLYRQRKKAVNHQ